MLGNMVNSNLTNEDMPKILQYPGACGLTSLLMALKPKSRNKSKSYTATSWYPKKDREAGLDASKQSKSRENRKHPFF